MTVFLLPERIACNICDIVLYLSCPKLLPFRRNRYLIHYVFKTTHSRYTIFQLLSVHILIANLHPDMRIKHKISRKFKNIELEQRPSLKHNYSLHICIIS